MRLLKPLYVQVLIGAALAVALGLTAPALAVKMKPLGDGFISLLKMLLVPIIFCTVVHGLANIQDMRKLGRLGTKSLIYFETFSTLGLVVGALVGNVFHPAVGLHANLAADAFAKGDILQVLFISLLVGVAANLALERDSAIMVAVGELQTVVFKILGFIMYLAPLGAFALLLLHRHVD